ncbi:MAG TPA: YkgJ family cysteine cluster protein [Polyangia bacterium]|nr:YkgJ family cysteine cluster protein [Polyangia bacterium]
MARAKYDCSRCVAYCCSVYDEVQVDRRDLARLARHFGVSTRAATARFTKLVRGTRVLRRKRDSLFGWTCGFLDPKSRACGIYDARPRVCRTWPEHGDGCVYYDLLEFEREQQGDDRVVALIQIKPFKRRQ